MMQHTTHGVSLYLKQVFILCLAIVLALSLCPGIGAERAHAVTAAEKQAEAQEALANLNAMQETLDRLSMEYGEAVAAQEEAEASRDAAEARRVELESQIADLQERLGERAREMYRSGGVSFIEILLDTASFEEFATSLDMVNRVNANDAAMVQEQKSLKAEAEEQEAIYSEQAMVAAQKSQEAAEAAQQAEATVAEMQATYESLSAEAARLLEEEREAERRAEEARAAAIVEASARAAAEAQAAEANSGNSGKKSKKKSNDEGTGDVADEPEAEEPEAEEPETEESGAEETEEEPAAEEPEEPKAEEPAYEGGSDTVSRAYSCLGASYVWGGVGPGGYDCSGLVSYCLSGSHTRLGTTYTFMGWPQVSNPQPGDIAVNSGHTGIYIGDGQMIHAATYGVGVIIGPVQAGMIIVRYPG